jgi:phosphoribosylglycinamide formyltransferase-1
MRNKVACYCSGNASRIIKFYKKYEYRLFPLEFIFYDGNNIEILRKLREINSEVNIINYSNEIGLKGRKLSQDISFELLKNLNKYNVLYLFCFGTMILKSPLINEYENRIINFHPSLLPAFPGINAIDQALDYGVKYLGNTAHFIDEGIDTGKIISQTIISVKEFKGYEDVLGLQLDMLKNLFIEVFNNTDF